MKSLQPRLCIDRAVLNQVLLSQNQSNRNSQSQQRY